jgi:putative transcriptional regulator
MGSLQGHFLLAVPALPDENFFRSVVLMVTHDEQGALGLVLNRPTNKKFGEVWSQFTGKPSECSLEIYWGGPVDGPPILIHTQRAWAEVEVIDGVYMSAAEENVNHLIISEPEQTRLFCGYSGWGPQQLEQEIKCGGWLVTPGNAEDVFDETDELWKKIGKQIGGHVLFSEKEKQHLPNDPSMN